MPWLAPAPWAPSVPQLVPTTFALQADPTLPWGFASLRKVESKNPGPRATSPLHIFSLWVIKLFYFPCGRGGQAWLLQCQPCRFNTTWLFPLMWCSRESHLPSPPNLLNCCLGHSCGDMGSSHHHHTCTHHFKELVWGTAPLSEVFPGMCHTARPVVPWWH